MMRWRYSIIWTGLFSLLVPALTACSLFARSTPPSLPTGRLIVGGSGSAYPPLIALTRKFSDRYPHVQVTFDASSQTSSAVKAVARGTYDIGAIARPLRESELLPGTKVIPVARDAVVIAVHTRTGIEALSTSQLQSIYRGAVRSWADLGGTGCEIIVLDRAEEETAKIVMRQYVLGVDLTITPDAIMLPTEKDMFEAVVNTPGTIGYFSMSYVSQNSKVRAVRVDGVQPSQETLSSGAYPIVRPIGIVVREDRASDFPLREFLAFLASREARDLVRKEGLEPEMKP